MSWQISLAWSVAVICALLAARLLRQLKQLDAPAPDELRREILADVSGSEELARRAAVADLNQRLSDISFELGLLPARFAALTRICLASAAALALFGYIGTSANGGSALERVLGLVACAAAGLLGAASIAGIGRAAKERCTAIRRAWDLASHEAGKALGTSLEPLGRANVKRGR